MNNKSNLKQYQQRISDLLDEFIMLEIEHSYYDDRKRDRFMEEMKLFAPQPFVEQHLLVLQLLKHIAKREAEGTIRTKTMSDGTIRTYDALAHALHCCGTIEHWKKCPENDCIMDNSMPTCPYFKDIVNRSYIDTKIIGLDNDPKTGKEEKENSGKP
ncbi:MAG: hypothetical protein NWE93_04690 [Candidatus Bathyarchaeota archaeon]|nr:hypothetical protein [Candidatus Bathyarchaeota archaeon]